MITICVCDKCSSSVFLEYSVPFYKKFICTKCLNSYCFENATEEDYDNFMNKDITYYLLYELSGEKCVKSFIMNNEKMNKEFIDNFVSLYKVWR